MVVKRRKWTTNKRFEDVADAAKFWHILHSVIQIFKNGHFLVLACTKLINGHIIFGNTETPISFIYATVNKLFFFQCEVRCLKLDECKNGTRFLCKQRNLRCITGVIVAQGIDVGKVRCVNVHDIDVIGRTGRHRYELSTNSITTVTVVAFALDRSQNECLNSTHTETKCEQVRGKCLTGTGCAKDSTIGVTMDISIHNINDNQGVVCCIGTNHNTVRVLHFEGYERIKRRSARGQNISLRMFIKLFFKRTCRQGRHKGFLHSEIASDDLVSRTLCVLFKFMETPFKFC